MPIVQPVASGDGKIHRYHSGHITPALPNLATAIAWAAKIDVTVGQPGRYGGGTGGAFSDDMIAANPALLMFPYAKGVQYEGAGGDFPDRWYSHRLDGTKLFFSTFNVYIMEATGYSVSKTFQGITATSWNGWHAQREKADLDAANAAVAGSPWCGFWLDSLGPRFSYSVGPPAKPGSSPARNYTIDEWQLQMLSVVDHFRAQYPGLPVWANGFNTDAYGQQLRNHVDGIWREGWLRGASTPVGTFPTTDKWKTDLQQLMDAQSVIPVSVTTKLWTTHTLGQRKQWRDYTIASYLIADRGRLYYEFLPDHLGPWASGGEMNLAVYDIDLGAPLDSHGQIADYASATGVFKRRYTNGIAIVNTTGSTVSVSLDRAYKDVGGTAVGNPLFVQAHSGAILLTDVTTPPLPNPPPVVTITAPVTGSTVTVATVALSATVTADAGIDTVQYRILGTTDWIALPSTGGDTYGATITLNSQAGTPILNTISVRCIDLDGQAVSDVVEVTSSVPFRRRGRK